MHVFTSLMYDKVMYSPTDGYLESSLPRAIEPYLAADQAIKVKVLEGARAAGKTTVARRLIESGQYDGLVNLADPDTLARARANPRFFTQNLARRVVIDEAQLLGEELSLAVKDVVDVPGTDRRFLLTGSARIARTGLGGADPLAGRVERWTLDPFSASEIRGQPDALASLVDRLFGPPPDSAAGFLGQQISPKQWMLTGGLPSLSLGRLADKQRQRIAAEWRDSVLTEQVLPGEGRADLGLARLVLDCLLHLTATHLNVQAVATKLELDPRTVNRYIDVFVRRFMIRFLPNLALGPSRQTRRGAKLHPTDLSLARQALASANPDTLNQPETVGRLFETWVVNQALAGCPFAEQPTEAFSWRPGRGTHEVDLVLVSAGGQRVGIEVKSSTTIHPRDARGLQALEQAGNLHAGYIIYGGQSILRLGERLWALPVEHYLEGWTRPTAVPKTRDTRNVAMPRIKPEQSTLDPVAASVFVSYVHQDNEFLDGAITGFAQDLGKAFHFAYGRRLDLFLDQWSLRWGEDWEEQIKQAVEKTGFLLANVTPRFLRSANCRKEILGFDAAASVAKAPGLILPLIWQPIDIPGIKDQADPVYCLVTSSQYQVVKGLSSLTRGTAEYRQRILELAEQLNQTIISREAAPGLELAVGERPGEELDYFEAAERVKPTGSEFVAALKDVIAIVELMMAEFGPNGPQVAVIASHRARLDLAVQRLTSAKTAMATVWETLTKPIREPTESGVLASRPSAADFRAQLLGLVEIDLGQIDQTLRVLDAVGRASRQLRPSMQAIGNALRTIDAIQVSAKALAANLQPDD